MTWRRWRGRHAPSHVRGGRAPSTAGRCPTATTSPRDVCDKHPRDKLAMVHERYDGAVREVTWGELQDLAGARRRVLAAQGVQRGDRVAVVAAADARDRGRLLRRVEARGDPALDVRALRRRGDRPPRCATRSPRVLVTDADNAGRFDASLVDDARDPRRRDCSRRPSRARRPPTPPPTTPRSSTTPRAPPGWRRASSTPTATSSPTRSSSTATRSRTASASTAWASGRGPPGIAPLLGPVAPRRRPGRPAAPGRLRPPPAARRAQPPRGDERLHHADRDAGDDGHRGRGRRATPSASGASASAGEPLNPEAIRWFREQYGLTVLDYYGLTESYPLCANFPWHGGPRGLDGPPHARLGRADPRRGRAGGRARASAGRSACGRARTRTGRWATGRTRRRPRRPSAASGSTRRTPRSRTRTDGSGTPAAPTTSSSPPATASARSRSSRPASSTRPCARRPPSPRRTRSRGTSSRPSSCSPTAHEADDETARRRSRPSSAGACRPTPTRARSSSSTSCPRRSRARSAASSCASARPRRGLDGRRVSARDVKRAVSKGLGVRLVNPAVRAAHRARAVPDGVVPAGDDRPPQRPPAPHARRRRAARRHVLGRHGARLGLGLRQERPGRPARAGQARAARGCAGRRRSCRTTTPRPACAGCAARSTTRLSARSGPSTSSCGSTCTADPRAGREAGAAGRAPILGAPQDHRCRRRRPPPSPPACAPRRCGRASTRTRP